MVSEKEKLREEIRIVKEAIAQKQKRRQIGFNKLNETEQDVTVPQRFQHLLDQDVNRLRDHLQRLKEDLDDLQNLNDPQRFEDAVGYHGGRRIKGEDDE
jgi:hypothetical protein